jgi:hypothetical protein
MGQDSLTGELDQVAAELAAARTEYASLGARIAGLEARHLALSKALARSEQGTAATGAAPKHRTDAIVAVLAASGSEMSIRDVIAALADAGRPGETYDNVGADLAYLAERGRVRRVRRGVYAPASAGGTNTTASAEEGRQAGADRARPARAWIGRAGRT